MDEKISVTLVGEVHDSIKFVEDGEVKLSNGATYKGKAGDTLELPVVYNTVVNSFHTLVAMLIKGENDLLRNLWWEVGSGSSSWKDDNLPVPSVTDTSLTSPLFRKKIDFANVVYLDPSTGNVSQTPTPKIQVSCTFGASEANGYLREFSLFLGGTGSVGTGLPLNRKIHGVIYKTSGIELQRKIHFHFKGGTN